MGNTRDIDKLLYEKVQRFDSRIKTALETGDEEERRDLVRDVNTEARWGERRLMSEGLSAAESTYYSEIRECCW